MCMKGFLDYNKCKFAFYRIKNERLTVKYYYFCNYMTECMWRVSEMIFKNTLSVTSLFMNVEALWKCFLASQRILIENWEVDMCI